MDNVPTQIAYWNAALHCEYANAAYLDWFGTTFEAIRRLTVQELLGETLLAQSATYLQAALAGEPQLFERGLPRADGSTAYTQIRYLPDRIDGEVRGMPSASAGPPLRRDAARARKSLNPATSRNTWSVARMTSWRRSLKKS